MAIERETIVTSGGGNGGVIAAVVGAILLVIFLVWALNGGLNFGGAPGGTIDVDVPAVTVTPDGQ